MLVILLKLVFFFSEFSSLYGFLKFSTATVVRLTLRANGLMSCSVLDNSCIQCSHGKIPLSKAGSVKRLSTGAWTKFSKVTSF